MSRPNLVLTLLFAFGLGSAVSPRYGVAQPAPGRGKCVGVSATYIPKSDRQGNFPPWRVFRIWEDGTVDAIDNWTKYTGGEQRDKSENWLTIGK